MDTVFLALRVVVALGAVFGALMFAHRWITKGRPGSKPRNRQIEVVARQGLGAKAGIAVVDAGGRRYLLGVTEQAVTVLDTLGPAEAPTGEPALVTSQPISVARFEQELRTVTIATADVPIVVHGASDPRDPSGPVTQTVSIMPANRTSAGPVTEAIRLDGMVSYTRPATSGIPLHTSRRAARAAEQQAAAGLQAAAQQPSAQGGALAGSVLSPATWKQTFDALKKLR
ncbi:MAG: flagellar biosynthetic protein FliO [Acidobacteria bacterium]|nr:flagellar biosynthetic protein FliO [Acidobacteriota bacterium]